MTKKSLYSAEIFPSSKTHADVVSTALSKNTYEAFIGAGIFDNDGKAQWGSNSCIYRYGVDRPEDNAEEVIQEFRKALKNLLESE